MLDPRSRVLLALPCLLLWKARLSHWPAHPSSTRMDGLTVGTKRLFFCLFCLSVSLREWSPELGPGLLKYAADPPLSPSLLSLSCSPSASAGLSSSLLARFSREEVSLFVAVDAAVAAAAAAAAAAQSSLAGSRSIRTASLSPLFCPRHAWLQSQLPIPPIAPSPTATSSFSAAPKTQQTPTSRPAVSFSTLAPPPSRPRRSESLNCIRATGFCAVNIYCYR